MTKTNLIKKLTSRKFIIAAITAIVGIITVFVGDNETVNIIAGAAMTIVPTIVYCVVEGMVDAKSVETVTNATADAAEKLGADKSVVDTINQVGNIGEILVGDE
jgi:hypothetical protein